MLSSSQFEGLAGNPGMGRQYFESSFVSLVIACEVLVYLCHSITGHAHCDTGWAIRETIKKNLPPTLVRVNSGGVHIYLKTSYDASRDLTSRRLTQSMRLIRENIETNCLKPVIE